MKQGKKHFVLAMSIATTITLLTACGAQSTSQNNMQHSNITANVKTTFISNVSTPTVGAGTFVHPQSSVIGNVKLTGKNYIAPFASIRGDEGQPIHIGSETNIQDGVVIHGLETEAEGKPVTKNQVTVQGKSYSVYIGDRVSVAHQAQIHGPAKIGNDVFVGMQAFVFKATIGNGVVIEPTAKVIGVTIPEGRYVPAGTVLTKQEDADNLPVIDKDYTFAHLNHEVVKVNKELAEGNLK